MKHADPVLIDREVPERVPELAAMKDALERIANYGTHLIMKCGAESYGQDVSSIILLGVHVVKMIDSISILVGNSCIESAQVLMRSLMEATFGLMFMAQGDYERKSRQYIVAYTHKQIDLYEKVDPQTQSGKQFIARAKGRSTGDPTEYARFDMTKEIANLRSLLSEPEYVPIEAEWTKCKKTQRQIWWYSLFGGPKSIEELADCVKCRDIYEFLYRAQSGEVHATNALGGVHLTKKSEQALRPIRYPIQAPQTTSLSISLARHAYESLITALAPSQNEGYNAWYHNQIKGSHLFFAKLRFNDSDREMRTPKDR